MTDPSRPAAEHEPACWLLLRGLGREARHWGSFPQVLEAALRQRGRADRVASIDLPGTGALDAYPAPYSIGETAAMLRRIWAARAQAAAAPPAGRRYLVALSLGGMVANAWVARWPADFTGCVLINTSLRGCSPAYRRLRPSAYARLVRILCERDARAREEAILGLVSNRQQARAAAVDEWTRIAATRPLRRATVLRQLTAAALYRAQAPAIPTLVLGSRGDRLVHPSCAAAIAARWASPLRLHPDAGHDLPLDAPAWVAEEITAWATAATRP